MNSSGCSIFSRKLKSSHSKFDKFPFIMALVFCPWNQEVYTADFVQVPQTAVMDRQDSGHTFCDGQSEGFGNYIFSHDFAN